MARDETQPESNLHQPGSGRRPPYPSKTHDWNGVPIVPPSIIKKEGNGYIGNSSDKKNNDNLEMWGATFGYTALCFTALALGGTTIAPTILTVASVAVVGVGVGIAGYYAVEFVKNKFERTAPSPNPCSLAKSSVEKEVKGASYF
jgi:hypothetical protein